MPRRSDDELLALVRQKAVAIRHRRSMTALGAGTLALLLLASGVALAGNGGSPSKRTIRAVNAPTTSTSPAPDDTTVPETSTTALPTTTTTRPKPTTTTEAQTAPAPLDGRITASPDNAPTATLVNIAVHVTDGRGSWWSNTIDFGDGTPKQGLAAEPGCAPRAPGQPEPPAPTTDETRQFSHGYRHPGIYVVKDHVSTTTFCSSDDAPESRDLSVTITVEPGPTPSNGPVQPKAFLSETWPPSGDRSQSYVSVSGRDDDGFVSSFSIDWGDGTAPTTHGYPLTDCRDPGTTWPSSSAPAIDATHTYAAPGTYTARVTFTSVGCDGKDAQSATAEMPLAYPPPAPPG